MLDRDHDADRRMAETPSLMNYLPRILAYPLSGHALGALLMFVLFLWIGFHGLTGIALLAIVTPWFFHYAEGVIDRTSQGQATPPRFGGEMLFIGSNVTALRPLIGVGIVAIGYVAAIVGDSAMGSVVALTLGALFIPAFMLILTVENSLAAALNPLQIVATIFGVGPIYLLLSAILAAVGTVLAHAATSFAQVGSLFAIVYLWLMSCHLLGYVAFHRAPQLGLKLHKHAPTDESRRMEQQEARLAEVLRNVDAALHERNLDGAAKALFADAGGLADARLYHEELFEQMQRRQSVALVHAQGARLISVLISRKHVARALEITESCFDAHKEFAPERAAEAVILATAALAAKKEGLFTRLTHDCAARYAKDSATLVSLQFLVAKFAYEQQRDEAKAREILKPLLAQTAHPQHRQIAAYAKALGA